MLLHCPSAWFDGLAHFSVAPGIGLVDSYASMSLLKIG